ncbi:hypothetical protein [Streptosporangium roseum]|uniref:hypothetical protein n=1 Tax=Streptosporangium roseum TaxID=2001 RepID=UPI0004CCA0C5|nr:hypothetical protein [Streptosporangium roseum]
MNSTVEETAEGVVRAVAARRRWDEAELADILAMLGLTPAPAPAKKRASPRPRTGTCAACGRRSLRVRADGVLMAHSVYPDRLADDSTCPGGAAARARRTR